MIVCVNNLGALSVLEMAVITRAAIICLGNSRLAHFIELELMQIKNKLQSNVAFLPMILSTSGDRESRRRGLQGDVRLLHDVVGDGRGVAVSDES